MTRGGMVLEVPAYGTEVRIDLLWELAPRTCAAIWEQLPIEKPAFHGRRSGQELFLLADPFDLPGPENLRRTVHAGDVLFAYLPPGWKDRHPEIPSANVGLYDIALIYGSDALVRGPEGVVEANLFGRVPPHEHPSLAAACQRMWREGTENVVLRRAET